MDLITRLQQIPVGRFHYRLLIITGLGWLFDAMDTGLIAFILAQLSDEWQLLPNQKAMIVSICFLGMAIGAVLFGFLADKMGRKIVFIATLVIYSVGTALCGVALDYDQLLAFRFIVGIGLGGQLPVAVSLLSEYIPAKVRGKFIVLLESFWGLGWLVVAIVSFFIIPVYGWQYAFLIGGIPVFYAIYVWYHLPESILFLINKGKLKEAHDIISKLEKENNMPVYQEIIVKTAIKQKQTTFKELWNKPLIKSTMMLWLVWFGLVFSYYGIFTWLPSLLVQQGFEIVKSFKFTLILIIAQLPGYLAAAWLIDRFGRKKIIIGFLSFCGLSAYFFGYAQSEFEIIFWGCLLTFFNLGAWGVLYTYTPEQYPSHIRAFGSGWASAIGRIGGILSPIIVTQFMQFDHAFHSIFILFTSVLFLISLVIMVLGKETSGKVLD